MSELPYDPAAHPDPGNEATEAAAESPVGDAAEESASAESTAGADASAETTGSKSGGRTHRWRARARRVVRSRKVWIGTLAVLFLLALTWNRCGLRGCPSVARLAAYQPDGASVLLDRNGEKFGDLAPVARQMVSLEALPSHVAAAFVAVEDRRFYEHSGVDWRRVVGAALANLRAGRVTQGSSTITMQLARNVFPERIRANDRTFRRKLLEVRVAREIEKRFAKDDILEMYLNHIYFGGGAYGIETASRMYFGRSAEQLTLEQAALLAALPKAPSHYDPRRRPERARERRDLVLALMAEQGRIAAADAERASTTAVRVRSASAPAERDAPARYFVAVIRELLEDRFGEDVYTRRLRVHTTLDPALQRATEEELERQIRQVEAGSFGPYRSERIGQHQAGDAQTAYLQGAAVMMEAASGDVLALVGGRDARHSTFNRAIAARRQIGSAFKPFVFATALARGWSPSSVLDDSPYRLVSGKQTWEPSNFDGEFIGPITVREALVYSRNVPTIRLADEVGESSIAKFARASGLHGDMQESPVIALGVNEASPLELVSAYSAFAGLGEAVEPRFVVRVEDEAGNVLWAPEVERHRVLDAGVAYIMTDMLADAVDRGTGRGVRSAGYRGPAAGKTGTTNDGADVWFVGYTPQLVGGVWIGFDRPAAIAARATGGSVAAPVWGRILRRSGDWARGSWPLPERVIRVAIDPTTGFALEDGCAPRGGEAVDELYLRGNEPRTACPSRGGRRFWLDRAIAWVGDLFSSEDGDDAQEPRTRPREDERRADAEFYRERYLPRGPIERPEPPPSRSSRRWSETQRWIDDLAEDLADDLADRVADLRPEEERLLGWLEGAVDALDEAGVRGREAARARGWVDELRNSMESARRSLRDYEEARIRQQLEIIARRVAPDGRLTDRMRDDIERQLRRSMAGARERGIALRN